MLWTLMSAPVGVLAVVALRKSGWPTDSTGWALFGFGFGFPLIGVVVLVAAVVSLVRGYRAIRLNRRDRLDRTPG
ncbi:MAG: hypothetical protein KDB60_01145 [Propionibacteriaceae bacterium]|nr:hypothetical protein [Propionibacteriaceae bacterium]